MMPKLLAALDFRSNNGTHRPLLDALDAIRRAEGEGRQFFKADEVTIEGVIRPKWRDIVAKELLDGLRAAVIERIVLASGDRAAVADAVVAGLPIDEVRVDLTPDQKIAIIREEHQKAPVPMVGDSVNDAPALAAADVGIAMGARGAAASAEVADVVLLVDRLDRVLSALRIAGRSRRIALQSVYAGVGLSFVGMVVASLGYLTLVRGALVQEAIDVAVILNALRALAAPAGAAAGRREPAQAFGRSEVRP